ncbi:putative nucleotidyltransferase substrate binding domain-containing protein [Vibrio sp.]|uniref:putative nucleotidyltransferase substrate binding domain-containing protein n=1 Tax=Vibrio sp. TaxID=678 RepID=UPI00311DE03C
MPEKFNIDLPPFNCLNENQKNTLLGSLDIAYFRNNEPLLKTGDESHYLHVIIKGLVEERSADGNEIFAHYIHDDIFDVRALFSDKIRHDYISLEDTLVYLLPRAIFVELYHENGQFAAYFDTRLAKRQKLLESAQRQKNLAEFILTKVDSNLCHPPLILNPDLPIQEATLALKDSGCDAALVRLHHDDSRLEKGQHPLPFAIITRTDMLHAVILEKCSSNTPISAVATYPVLLVNQGDFLFNAMITMTRHRVKRLMVSDGHEAVGMLDMTQILSAFSTHSHVLTLSIARATSVEELATTSIRHRLLVDSLFTKGIHIDFILELTSAINEQIIEKAFELIVPPAIQSKCCLVVLGSEGRGEQVLKTDQDNALIIQDEFNWPECGQVMAELTKTLNQLGYPLCPGNVMVNNSAWVRNQHTWVETLSLWAKTSSADDAMKLAIFSDAHAVAGNKHLITPIRHHLKLTMHNNMLALQSLTRPAVQFSLPLTLLGNVKHDKQGIDIKAGGIFPIVHGIRSLALEHGLDTTNTFKRIEQLRSKKILEPDTADNLTQALKLMFTLRLRQQLDKQHTHNHIILEGLDRTERDLLRHSLHVVKKFKQFLSFHYQIRD